MLISRQNETPIRTKSRTHVTLNYLKVRGLVVVQPCAYNSYPEVKRVSMNDTSVKPRPKCTDVYARFIYGTK